MSSDDGFKRKGRRMAAIEAAKRIKMNADANMSLSGGENKNDEFDELNIVTPSADNNNQRMRDRKRTRVSHSTPAFVSEMVRNLSKNVPKFIEANPSKSEDMLKKRRGRPPKSKSGKSSSMRNKNAKNKDPDINCDEEYDNDVNLRRESYNISRINKESVVAKSFCGPKQLQVENRDVSYIESLRKFSKDLGPTARKVAGQKLQTQGLIYQPRYWLDPFLPSPDTRSQPHFMGMNPFNSSVKKTITNQVSQPLMSFGNSETNAVANHKGKNIMVDDGKGNFNKWDVAENLEFLFGKRKGGVKIGNDPSNNQDFVHKNLGYDHVGNRGSINQMGSFFSNYNVNSNQDINKIYAVEDVHGKKEVSLNASELTPGYGKQNSFVYPGTHLPPSSNVPTSYLGFDSRARSIPRVAPPLAYGQSPVQPPQNWCPPPPATKMNPAVNDDFWKEQDLQLALDFNMQMTDQEPNIWSQSLWAPSQQNQFLQPYPLGPNQEQPQDTLLDLLTFDAQNNFGHQMGNNPYPPPGI